MSRPLSSDNLTWMIKDQTTKDDSYDELREFFQVGIDSEKLTWIYGYYKYYLISSIRTKDLVIHFNKEGTVHSYVFNTSFLEEKRNKER